MSIVEVEPTVHVTPSLAREREEEYSEIKEEDPLPEDKSAPSSSPAPLAEGENPTPTIKPKIWRIVDHIQND